MLPHARTFTIRMTDLLKGDKATLGLLTTPLQLAGRGPVLQGHGVNFLYSERKFLSATKKIFGVVIFGFAKITTPKIFFDRGFFCRALAAKKAVLAEWGAHLRAAGFTVLPAL